VLVSADSADYAEEAQQALTQNGLANAESWLFAGNFTGHLHYRINPNGYRELSKTYFYDASHERIGRSGTLSKRLLKS